MKSIFLNKINTSILQKPFVLLMFCTILIGCSPIETSKRILGVSVSYLDEKRIDADTKTFVCDYDQCFESVLSLARDYETLEPKTKKFYTTFSVKKDEGYIVVMDVPGNVDTTEVGIFLTTDGSHMTKIEIVSLSSSAQRKVSEAIFNELLLQYSEKKIF